MGLSSRSSARSRIARGATSRGRCRRHGRDCTGSRRVQRQAPLHAARCGVVEHRLASGRGSRGSRRPSRTRRPGRWRKPPWIINTAACSAVSSGSIVSGPRVIQAPTVASGVRPWATARRTSRSVNTPTRRSPSSTSTAPTRRSSMLRTAAVEIRVGVDGQDVGGHEVGNEGHGPSLRGREPRSK